jgi:hypothetical protein
MKRELVRGLAILNTCVKFRQNPSRYKVARAMTRQDHTYIRTYIHTYIHMYIHTYIHTYIRTGKNLYPPATSLQEEIIKDRFCEYHLSLKVKVKT